MYTYVIYRSVRTGEVNCCLKVYTNLGIGNSVSYDVIEPEENKGNIRVYQCSTMI